MTAIVGLFGPGVGKADEVTAAAALAAMALRGADRRVVWSTNGAVLGGAWHAWEEDVHEPGYHPLFAEGDIAVVADATLYYTAELRRKLASAGVAVPGSSPAALVAAAYRAWGEALVTSIEGDYAFVLYDARIQRLLVIRDPVGSRSLYFAELGSTLMVANEVRGVEAHPASTRALDIVGLAEQVAGFVNASDATHSQGVRLLRAGWRLTKELHGEVRRERFWTPPEIGLGTQPFDEAAQGLRDLLGAAASERACGVEPPSVWLSGGYDSTAVFAVLCSRVRESGAGERAFPHIVSMSYPPNDDGYEDNLIATVAAFWHRPVHWRRSVDTPLIADAPVKAARRRDVPVPHRFEHWLRSMAVGAREENSRTILNGHGGDNHFGLSSIYLAELLRRGRWRHLWRDWILRRGRSPRGALEKLVYPLLPRVITHVARLLRRGRPLSGTLDRDLPPWFDQRFARRHRLLEREYDGAPHLGSQDVAREEVYWLLADGQHPALNALMYGIGLDEGTALRTPMFDARVVRFAASRPMEERAAGLETKLLLRRSVRGLLPDSILEPRSSRTGSMTTFYKEGLMWRIPELRRIATGDSRLISLGFVDRVALHRTIEEFASEPASGDGGMLNVVLEVESWLLAR